jgi:FAD/FMN-containing dehydrogenases
MRRRKEIWQNWQGNLKCQAEVCYPENLDDLKAIVKRANMEGKTIRMSGGGRGRTRGSYSVSPIVKNDDGIIVKLENMNKGYAHNDNSGRVTVEAGMKVAQLEDLVARNGLSFEAMLVPTFVEVGGAVAVGSHGSGFNQGTLSDHVVSMDIVLADGSVKTITESDPELMKAARVNLGALGIVHTITFQCVKQFKLSSVTETLDVKTTINNIKDLVEAHDYFEVFWVPFCRDLWVKKSDKVRWETPNRNVPTRWERFVDWSQTRLGTVGLEILNYFPRLTPAQDHLLLRLQKNETVIAPAHYVFHYQEFFPRKLWDVSYGFDIGKDFSNFKSAWNFVMDLVCDFAQPKGSCTSAWPFSYSRNGIFPQNFVLHGRFIRNSDAYLAPSVGNSHTCMLQVVTYFGTDCAQFLADIEKHLLSLGGRPHWGKTFNTEIDFARLYGENLQKFNAIRRQMDPNGMFLNDFTRRVFAA